MNDHIAKPIDPDQLFGVLLRWIKRARRPHRGEARDGGAIRHAARASPCLAIPGIDVRAGLTRTGGNRGRYETLLRKFAEQQDDTIDRHAQRAVKIGDAATAERAAHSLKGAAGTFGAASLSEAAASAETAIKTGNGVDGAVQALSLVPRPGARGHPRRAARRSRRQRRRRAAGRPDRPSWNPWPG